MMMPMRLTKSALVISALFSSMFAMNAAAEDGMNIGGSVRVNYGLRFYDDQQKDKGGDFNFDVLTLKFDGTHGKWGLSSEYRFASGKHFIKWGYGYYQMNDDLQIQLGVNKTPFGNPGFISNSWWFGLPYYLGFEDDFDVGAKAVHHSGDLTTEFGFYKNGEYNSGDNKAYAPDIYNGVVNGTEYNNQETNQLNLRQVYKHSSGELTVKAGYSLEYGQIYNTKTEKNGDRYAVALHMDASYQGWNLQLQAMQYEFDAENPEGMDNNKIGLGGAGWQYEVASKAQIYSFNIAKTIPTSFGSIKFYNDFGMLTPDTDDSSFDDSFQNVTGAAISAGPVYIMADFIQGKNMTFSTKMDDHVGLPQAGDGWDQRININFGYYF
ncbi:outer membrane beta barrel protein [Ferrimonas sp. YFM]|nr:outer membrane beta barrel protein [Ferrimonas sp. YFM]